jgi:predicted ATPase with chaperone activity
VSFPTEPEDLRSTGIDDLILRDLAIKLAYTVPQLTTEQAADRMRLPIPLMESLLQQLTKDKHLEILGPSGPACYRYAITQRGCERAGRLVEVSSYVGPAPVSLESYIAFLEWQLARRPPISLGRVSEALSELVLEPEAVEVVGFAASSGRSLFLHGPPGNGKTSVGRLVHEAIQGDIWVPHCIGIDYNIIQVFDPQCHSPADPGVELDGVDRRWVRIRPPFVVAGGELTIEQLDLIYSPTLRFYQAPLHLKANGGLYLIDDFGRQRVEPHVLLNRWILPLEHQVDHLTLRTGQQILVPFRQMLIIATNLDPRVVMDNSFLRRMGYRLHLSSPTPERYSRIFERYASRAGAPASAKVVARMLERYRNEKRDPQCCEPRDLIDRARDICRVRGRTLELTDAVMDLAWDSYFGTAGPAGHAKA